MRQSRNNASRQKILMRTANPTKTVAALNAGLRMEAKVLRLPEQRKLSFDMASSLPMRLGLSRIVCGLINQGHVW